ATRVATTNTATPVVESTGVNPRSRPWAERTAMSVTIEYTNVATKIPNETFVSRDRTNTRTARGEYWLAASWIATSVVENTMPRNANIPVATTEVSVNA